MREGGRKHTIEIQEEMRTEGRGLLTGDGTFSLPRN